MDPPSHRGVYEEATRNRSETNADELSRVLSDLPLIIHKESLGSQWGRHHQVLLQSPDLVLIHRSAFFHALNAEFGFSYEDEPGYDEKRWRLLYDLTDAKLVTLLGYISREHRQTRFLVYSRGTGGGWADPESREAWTQAAVNRFPELRDRLHTMQVPGGVAAGSFTTPNARSVVRERVTSLLGLAVP